MGHRAPRCKAQDVCRIILDSLYDLSSEISHLNKQSLPLGCHSYPDCPIEVNYFSSEPCVQGERETSFPKMMNEELWTILW